MNAPRNFKQPYEGVTGQHLDDDLLSLDDRALTHRRALVVLARNLRDAVQVGQPAPIVQRMGHRLRTPRPGDLVVETSRAIWGRHPEDYLKGLGYLVDKREEWWTTDEEWEREKAEEGFPDDERATDVAWYIQYGPDPADIIRWTNCQFMTIPIDPGERFHEVFGTRDGGGVTLSRDDLLGALADSGIQLRTVR